MYIQRALIDNAVRVFVRFKELFQMRDEVTNWEKPIRSGLSIQFFFSLDKVLSYLIYINSQWDSVVVIICCEYCFHFSEF